MLTPDAARTAALRNQAVAALATLAYTAEVSPDHLYTAMKFGLDGMLPPTEPVDEVNLVAVVGAVHAVAARVGEYAGALGREVYEALVALDTADYKATMLGCECAERIALIRDTCDNH